MLKHILNGETLTYSAAEEKKIRAQWAAAETEANTPRVPDEVTLSDWRVALIKMGRFDDVSGAVKAANESGTIEGQIAWQRFEYANNVYRSELLEMAPLFGFSTADVDASLVAAVS